MFFAYGVDAVEVVRCGECKHWVAVVDKAAYGLCGAIKSDLGVRGRNEYCSRGERKGESG